jgi:3-methyladenine DNA glycosylase AlkD
LEEIIQKIRAELINNIDEKYLISIDRFFKEKHKDYGVRTPIVRKIAKRFYKDVKNYSKKELLEISEELLKSGYNEESTIAVQWITQINDNLTKEDFKILEKWVDKYIDNWGKVDDFCLKILSHYIIKFPEHKDSIKSWTSSKNLWKRRCSAVGFIKSGSWRIHAPYLKDVFEVALILMEDKEDLVRKGYGWMLKIAAEDFQKEVFDFVMKHKKIMPRVSLRYAIEKMPQDLKKKAMAK